MGSVRKTESMDKLLDSVHKTIDALVKQAVWLDTREPPKRPDMHIEVSIPTLRSMIEEVAYGRYAPRIVHLVPDDEQGHPALLLFERVRVYAVYQRPRYEYRRD